jgi:hypothetical protein
MGVAADCVYTDQYGAQSNATTQILTNWNTASALYKVYSLNAQFFLVYQFFPVYI